MQNHHDVKTLILEVINNMISLQVGVNGTWDTFE